LPRFTKPRLFAGKSTLQTVSSFAFKSEISTPAFEWFVPALDPAREKKKEKGGGVGSD